LSLCDAEGGDAVQKWFPRDARSDRAFDLKTIDPEFT
jgi:hypothetical protein